MYFFDAAEIETRLDFQTLVPALFEAHKGTMPSASHLVEDEPGGNGENKFIALLAWAARELIVTKLVGVFPGNTKLVPAQPSIQGLVAAFDATTGAARFVADGAALTYRKTAADSGLGASLLARPDAEILLVVGAGGLAPHMIEAHCSVRPSIRKVLVWNRTIARAVSLVARLEMPNVEVVAVSDLDQAVGVADIISCVTMSDRPLIKGELLRPGSHIDLVGAYRPDMREADDTTMTRGTIFVDTRSGMTGAGDLVQPIHLKLLSWADVKADLFELCGDRTLGRQDAEEITIFKNVGGAHLDLFTAVQLNRLISAS